MNMEQKPSIGRIVIYNHPGSADGLHSPKQSPAIVQKVNDDGTLEMVVFSVYGGLFFNHNVKQSTAPAGGVPDPSSWEWPTRQ